MSKSTKLLLTEPQFAIINHLFTKAQVPSSIKQLRIALGILDKIDKTDKDENSIYPLIVDEEELQLIIYGIDSTQDWHPGVARILVPFYAYLENKLKTGLKDEPSGCTDIEWQRDL